MAFRTILFTFKAVSEQEKYVCTVGSVLNKYFPALTNNQTIQLGEDNGFLKLFSSETSSITFYLRYYHNEKLFVLNGDVGESSTDFQKLNNFTMDRLRNEIKKEIENNVETGVIVKRNPDVPVYFETADFRCMQYDFDQVLVNEQSQYQNIKILHSPTLGNCLILDEMQNLGECDINYTRGLMNYGKNQYKDKEILILGGGDGALLHELLKESPKFVTMIDIDELVMKYCRLHLRGACGDTLDNFDGPNYKVIVGDCLKYMQDYIQQNRSFDVIFNDLTDIPISTKDNKELLDFLENTDEKWNFVKEILELSLKLLRPTGLYLNHATGSNCKNSLSEYENLLKSMPVKLNFSSHTAYVPSFYEEWVFYQIWKA